MIVCEECDKAVELEEVFQASLKRGVCVVEYHTFCSEKCFYEWCSEMALVAELYNEERKETG